MLNSAWDFLQVHAPWLDALALFVVCYCAIKERCLVSLVVLLDFTLVYFGQDFLQSLELWGAMGMDYHYSLGIKDALVASLLLLFFSCPTLILLYVLASVVSFTVWLSYSVMQYETFLQLYYAWSPVYFIIMLLQVIVFFISGTDFGKRARARVVLTDWDRFFQSFNRAVYARTTLRLKRNEEKRT